ncbi:hypothetical protein HYZ97_00145 [Candidatus Pacearchaeota archaeon]|nr:hypothetical protein [Candidatus Pacearchaeota archaeon]
MDILFSLSREAKTGEDPRDYFDNRPEILRTFTEAAQIVTDAELYRGGENGRLPQRNQLTLLWNYDADTAPRGFLVWELMVIGGNGIANYNEQARLLLLLESPDSFVTRVLRDDSNIGIMPMDRPALTLLERQKELDLDILKSVCIGIKKLCVDEATGFVRNLRSSDWY